MPRNRVKNEVGKGVEALRHAKVDFVDVLAGSVTYVGIVGPFETDIDVKEIMVTPGALTAGSANTLDVFNGTVAGAVAMITQFDPDTIANQVPSSVPIVGTGRVLAGTPISVRFVAAAAGNTTPNTLSVRIGYDIPIYDQNAKISTYGAYDDGQ